MQFVIIVRLALALAAGTAAGAVAAAGSELKMYTATVEYGVVPKLREQGYDVTRVRRIPASTQVQIELVLRPHQVAKLEAQGVTLEPWRGANAPNK